MKSQRIRIGSRASRLAVIQSEWVMQQIHQIAPEIQLELVTMQTTGDKILHKTLDQIGGKGLFLKELDAALLANEVDLCVHSLKDVPVLENPALPIVAYPKRAPACDVMVLPKQQSFADWNRSFPVGSASSRRTLQFQMQYPACTVHPIRGNVLTRLEKLDRGEYGALILAEAGLQRLRLEYRITRRFSPIEIVPAAGQGILAVQGRAGEYTDLLQRLNDPQAAFCAKIERAVSKALNGDCTAPIGAYADLQGENVTLYGFYAEDGIGIKSTLTGSVTQAGSLANTFAEQLKQQVQEKKEDVMNLIQRPRRLRNGSVLRSMVRETRISADTLIYPMFVMEGTNIKEEIATMPGQYRWSIDRMDEILQELTDAGVKSVLLFGIPKKKDEIGSSAWAEDGIVQQAIRHIKQQFPQLYVITDVCMCEYTSHGHCGILCGHSVDNDQTLEVLAKTALSHVQAGADMVAPSDMMDGRVGKIRAVLDENGFSNTPIMSYSVKYASAFYGPFRDAAGSAPAFGDRKGYQMDPHNLQEAIREAELDVQEGADILMVKPGMAYLDVLYALKERFPYPIATYSVSGEYAMIKAAGMASYVDEAALVCESAVCMYRAGADLLITYFAKELAQYIKEGRIG